MTYKRYLTVFVILLTLTGCQTVLAQKPIKVGILHSLSGTMAISEGPVVDATMLAIEQLNAQGGLLGRPIEPLIVDGKSDWALFAQEAERLITEEQVDVIFGCWTSACRKTVKPIFEQYDHLLIYPVQYEGLESSPNIVYTGAAPNQQIIPAVKWSLDNLGHRFFLVGSDYVFPRTANAIIKDQVNTLQGHVVGEEYILLGSNEVDEVVQKIVRQQPDVILNTINGDTNVAFFKALRNAGVVATDIPTLSFSIAESELQSMPVSDMVGDYAVWNYFQTIDRPENERFVTQFQARYGAERVISDPMEAAFFGVQLWAQAVERAGTAEVETVRRSIRGQSFNAPQGIVVIDPETQHSWKTVRVGQIQPNGQFEILWSSEAPIRPQPYPLYRPKTEWLEFLDELYLSWDSNWANSKP